MLAQRRAQRAAEESPPTQEPSPPTDSRPRDSSRQVSGVQIDSQNEILRAQFATANDDPTKGLDRNAGNPPLPLEDSSSQPPNPDPDSNKLHGGTQSSTHPQLDLPNIPAISNEEALSTSLKGFQSQGGFSRFAGSDMGPISLGCPRRTPIPDSPLAQTPIPFLGPSVDNALSSLTEASISIEEDRHRFRSRSPPPSPTSPRGTSIPNCSGTQPSIPYHLDAHLAAPGPARP
jgi:hypothetical protein